MEDVQEVLQEKREDFDMPIKAFERVLPPNASQIKFPIRKLKFAKIRKLLNDSKNTPSYETTVSTLIYFAARRRNTLALRYLRSKNVSITTLIFNQRFSSLACAAEKGSLKCVKYLLKLDASELKKDSIYHPLLCVLRAIRTFNPSLNSGRYSVLNYLIREYLDSVNINVLIKSLILLLNTYGVHNEITSNLITAMLKRDGITHTKIFAEICTVCSVPTIENYYRKYIAGIALKSEKLSIIFNRLKEAIINKDNDIVEFFLKLNIYLSENDLFELLNIATNHEDYTAINLFIKHISKEQLQLAFISCLKDAMKTGNLKQFKYILKRKFIQNTHLIEESVMSDACCQGHLEYVKTLLRYGITYDNIEQDKIKVDLLRWINIHANLIKPIRESNVAIVKEFLEKNELEITKNSDYYLSYTDEYGKTIEYYAVTTKDEEIRSLLNVFIIYPLIESKKTYPDMITLNILPRAQGDINLKYLTEVDLPNQKLGDVKAHELCECLISVENAHFLHTLQLSNNCITQRLLYKLSELLYKKANIVNLDLSNNMIGNYNKNSPSLSDKPIESLVKAVSNNKKFSTLNLSCNLLYFGQKTFNTLFEKPLVDHPALKPVDISGNFLFGVKFSHQKVVVSKLWHLRSMFFSDNEVLISTQQFVFALMYSDTSTNVFDQHLTCMIESVTDSGQRLLKRAHVTNNTENKTLDIEIERFNPSRFFGRNRKGLAKTASSETASIFTAMLESDKENPPAYSVTAFKKNSENCATYLSTQLRTCNIFSKKEIGRRTIPNQVFKTNPVSFIFNPN